MPGAAGADEGEAPGAGGTPGEAGFGAPGTAPGALGAFASPRASCVPGAIAAPSKSSPVAPHAGHDVASLGMSVPHFGHVINSPSKLGGLKHTPITSLTSSNCLSTQSLRNQRRFPKRLDNGSITPKRDFFEQDA